MKKLLLFAILLCPSILMGGLGMRAMKSAPPKAETIGEILSNVRDAGPMGFENHFITKEELALFLTKGHFTNSFDDFVRKWAEREEKSTKGGPVYCSGVFATKEGKVFKFDRINKHVLMIEGTDGGGWIVLEGEQAATPHLRNGDTGSSTEE